jgi:hypothetical protein
MLEDNKIYLGLILPFAVDLYVVRKVTLIIFVIFLCSSLLAKPNFMFEGKSCTCCMPTAQFFWPSVSGAAPD